jgi:hypothetical protein
MYVYELSRAFKSSRKLFELFRAFKSSKKLFCAFSSFVSEMVIIFLFDFFFFRKTFLQTIIVVHDLKVREFLKTINIEESVQNRFLSHGQK